MKPLVSCIMPTTPKRRHMIERAMLCFKAQTYERTEIVAVHTDGTIGRKRNTACEIARGDIICHWDDDDWYGPDRIAEQVEALIADDALATGYNSMPFADDAARRAWLYRGIGRYAIGTSLVYWRDTWRRFPFPDQMVQEGAVFVDAIGFGMSIANGRSIVARIHDDNTCKRDEQLMSNDPWSEIPYESLAERGYPINV